MNIDYKNYKVYLYTKKELEKKFTKSTLTKYGKKLAFLYQNCFEIDRMSDSDIEEQFWLFNGLNTYEDFEELCSTFRLDLYTTLVGSKIVGEEFLNILEAMRPAISEEFAVQKVKAINSKNIVQETVARIAEITNSSDIDISLFFEEKPFPVKLTELVDEIEELYDNDEDLRAYMRFYELYKGVFQYYIQITHQKTDSINLTKRSLINDQLYGATGGYDSIRRIIKTCPASAVENLRFFKNDPITDVMTKAKFKIICEEIIGKDKDLGEFQIVKDFTKGKNVSIEEVKKLVIPCLENGIINLLCLKHNLNLLDDPRNGKRVAALKDEAAEILKYSETK
jgi:hypothetical protein